MQMTEQTASDDPLAQSMRDAIPATPVAAITSLIVRGGQGDAIVQAFKSALRTPPAQRRHLMTLLLQQENGLSFVISLFRSKEDLQEWQAAAERQQMIRAFEDHSLRQLCTVHHRVAKLTVPSDESGPKWKVLLTTWLAMLPLLLLLNGTFLLILPDIWWPFRLVITSFLLSVSVIWFVSPVTRGMTRTWRLKNQQMRIDVIP
ncbi:hypothetical protein ACSBM8_06025 [Sphingomonas sp. ASY06-1R]|uniref:hypothetical protein n=1 Tax=Sphingomonas sp. ASY06-1R TaxID=3445771 RepID=UPI003FA321C7